MVVIVIMKHMNLCHQCAESNLLYHKNIKQYNGKFGCSTCKHPGRYSHSARQIRARLYEYWPSGTVAVRAGHETRMLLLIMNMISNYFQLAVSVFHTQSSNVI